GEAPGPPRGDLLERRVVEDHVRGDLLRPRAGEPPRLQLLEARRTLPRGGRPRRELPEEPARALHPADREDALRPRQADVEQAPLLGDLGVRPGLPVRELLLLHPREQYDLELEALGAVVGQQVHSPPRLPAPAEAALELGPEAGARPADLLREPHQPSEVALARLLPLAELVVRRAAREPPQVERDRADRVGRRSAVVEHPEQ